MSQSNFFGQKNQRMQRHHQNMLRKQLKLTPPKPVIAPLSMGSTLERNCFSPSLDQVHQRQSNSHQSQPVDQLAPDDHKSSESTQLEGDGPLIGALSENIKPTPMIVIRSEYQEKRSCNRTNAKHSWAKITPSKSFLSSNDISRLSSSGYSFPLISPSMTHAEFPDLDDVSPNFDSSKRKLKLKNKGRSPDAEQSKQSILPPLSNHKHFDTSSYDFSVLFPFKSHKRTSLASQRPPPSTEELMSQFASFNPQPLQPLYSFRRYIDSKPSSDDCQITEERASEPQPDYRHIKLALANLIRLSELENAQQDHRSHHNESIWPDEQNNSKEPNTEEKMSSPIKSEAAAPKEEFDALKQTSQKEEVSVLNPSTSPSPDEHHSPKFLYSRSSKDHQRAFQFGLNLEQQPVHKYRNKFNYTLERCVAIELIPSSMSELLPPQTFRDSVTYLPEMTDLIGHHSPYSNRPCARCKKVPAFIHPNLVTNPSHDNTVWNYSTIRELIKHPPLQQTSHDSSPYCVPRPMRMVHMKNDQDQLYHKDSSWPPRVSSHSKNYICYHRPSLSNSYTMERPFIVPSRHYDTLRDHYTPPESHSDQLALCIPSDHRSSKNYSSYNRLPDDHDHFYAATSSDKQTIFSSSIFYPNSTHRYTNQYSVDHQQQWGMPYTKAAPPGNMMMYEKPPSSSFPAFYSGSSSYIDIH